MQGEDQTGQHTAEHQPFLACSQPSTLGHRIEIIPCAGAGEQLPRRAPHLFAQRQSDGEDGDDGPCTRPEDEAGGRCVVSEGRGADGIAPQRRQTVDHRPGVERAGGHAGQAAQQRQPNGFTQQQSSHLTRQKSQGQHRADFLAPALHPELEKQRHQQQRRHNQKKAEPKKQPAKILGLHGRRQGLFPDRFETEPELLGCQRVTQPGGELFAGIFHG